MKLIVTDFKDNSEVLNIDLTSTNGLVKCDKTPQYKTYEFMIKPALKQINKQVFSGVFRDDDSSPIYATWNFHA
jgi:hypothetical protein